MGKLKEVFVKASIAILETMNDTYTPRIAPQFVDWITKWRYVDFLMPRAARMRGNINGIPGAWEWLDALLSWHISLELRRVLVKKHGNEAKKSITAASNIYYEKQVENYKEYLEKTVQLGVRSLSKPKLVGRFECFFPELLHFLCVGVLDTMTPLDGQNNVTIAINDSTLPPFFWCVVPESVANGSVVDLEKAPCITTVNFDNDHVHVPR